LELNDIEKKLKLSRDFFGKLKDIKRFLELNDMERFLEPNDIVKKYSELKGFKTNWSLRIKNNNWS